MSSPRPIQWNDWARPSYAKDYNPVYNYIPRVNMSGFELPGIIPRELQDLGATPLDKDPSNFSKFDQLKLLGKGLSFGGEVADELYRGQTKYDSDWKIAGVPDVPGSSILKGTKATITATKKASRRAAAAKKLEDKIVSSLITESKRPQLKPELGFDPKSAQQRAAQSNPLFATVPERMLTSEGPAKTVTGATVPATAMGRPSLPYIRQQMQREGYLPDLMAPRQLEAPRARFYAGPGGISDAKNPFALGDLEAIRGVDKTPIPTAPPRTGLPELPNLDTAVKPTGDLPSLGHAPLIPSKSNWFRSIESRLRSDSPAGKLVADKFTAFRVDKGVRAGNWEAKVDEALGGLNDKEVEKIADALQSQRGFSDPRLEAARKKMVALDTEITQQAKAKQLKMRSKDGKELVEFTPHEGYWPRIYSPDFWKNPNNIISALKKKGYTEEAATKIVNRASLHGGRLIDEGAVKMARKKGAKLKDPQHVRQIDLEGYLKTKDAYKLHIRDMADRITAKEYFGDLDITGGDFKKLIDQTKDPEIPRLMARVFEREGDVPLLSDKRVTNAILTAETLGHLSNFVINNPLQLALSAAKAPRAIPAGLKSVFQRGARLKAATKSGALMPIHSDALAGTEGLINKAAHFANKRFGIEGSEKFVRSVSSAMGQDEATRLFNKLKRNPASDKIRNQIEELTMTPVNELLAQESLTAKQLDRAGGMFAARTQGRAQAFDLPYHLTGGTAGPWKNVGLQFSKYSIIQPKMLMEAARRKPIATPLVGAAGYYGGSEAIGGIKDAKRAAVASLSPDKTFGEAYKENRERRGEFGLPRVAKTLSESWMFGYPAKLASEISRSGTRNVAQGLAPPVAGDIFNAMEVASKIAKTEDTAEQAKLAAQFISRFAPYIGYDVATTLLATEQRNSRKAKKRY